MNVEIVDTSRGLENIVKTAVGSLAALAQIILDLANMHDGADVKVRVANNTFFITCDPLPPPDGGPGLEDEPKTKGE